MITASGDDAAEVERRFAGLPCLRVGRVTETPRLAMRLAGTEPIALDVERLKAAFKGTLADD